MTSTSKKSPSDVASCGLVPQDAQPHGTGSPDACRSSVRRRLLVVGRVLFIAVATLFFLAFVLTFFGGAQRIDAVSGFTSFCASLVPWFLKGLPLPVTPYNGYCHLDYGICFIVCGLCDFACAKFFARLPSQTV